MLCPRRRFWWFWAGWRWMKWIQVLSGLETHRSNEWEGSHGRDYNSVHAARDKVVSRSSDEKIDLNIWNKTPSRRIAPTVGTLEHISVGQGACVAYLPSVYFYSHFLVNGGYKKIKLFFLYPIRMMRNCISAIFGFRTRCENGSWAGPLARHSHPPKTPILGLPKSRPSPLQKCAKKCVFGRKSVHFRPFCAQFCTKMTSFLRT
jgi:hypothetical protein